MQDRDEEARERQQQRRHRESVVIPRLRAGGYLCLLLVVFVHNWLVLGSPSLTPLLLLAAVEGVYFAISKLALMRFARENARIDWSHWFLTGDIAVFAFAVYASGGERSWLLPVLCMRVADQVGTTLRRALFFAGANSLAHCVLIFYMAFVERRGFPLSVELAKAACLFTFNLYLALAAAPGERQRKRAGRLAEVMRNLIDELRRKTEQLEIQQAKAQAASRAKTAFLSNMSHEIRTPLNAVLGTTELLLQEGLPAPHAKMLETVQSAGKSLLGLVDDVLDMSKAEAGKLELRSVDMDLLLIVQGAVAPQRALAQRKGVELRLEINGTLDRPVRGDAMRLRQVLSTLVGNGVKFTDSGHVLVSVRIGAVAGDSVRVQFAVEDSGIGMTPEAAERVFEPFQQADESSTRRYGGSGLGLSISKRVVGLMGGQLGVRTELGRGSRFDFELAFALGTSGSMEPNRVDRERNAARLRSLAPHVLVVEDTEVNRALLQTMLERMGCRVTGVEDGARALAMLTREHDFDLVFMDWHMPVMDGLDAASRVRDWERQTRRPRIPIVGYTASAFADEVARCKQAGMDRVLNKPLIRSQLENVLWELIIERPTPTPPPAPESCLDALVIADLQALDAVESGFLRNLCTGFLERAPGLVADLIAAAATHDDERVRKRAHELRGSAGNLGATKMASALATLEREVREGSKADRLQLVQEVEREFARARVELEALLDERERTGPQPGHRPVPDLIS